MATFNKRYGWEWSEAERASRQTALAKVRHTAGKIAAQIPLIEQHAPELLVQAKELSGAIGDAIRTLQYIELRNSRRRKYQALSPEDVDSAFAGFNQAMLKWLAMTATPRYQTLVKAANKVTRRENARVREYNRRVTEEYERQAELENDRLLKFAEGLDELFQSRSHLESDTCK